MKNNKYVLRFIKVVIMCIFIVSTTGLVKPVEARTSHHAKSHYTCRVKTTKTSKVKKRTVAKKSHAVKKAVNRKKSVSSNAKQSQMVWVSSSKTKVYHSRKGCCNMKHPVQIKLSAAKARGLRPCKKCC